MRFYGTVCDRLKNPFKNIPVTDGRNIVFTDENGKFDFEGWDDAGILSLNILTKGHDDWYFMVDGHKGSYDFEIRPADEAENFSVLHTSDTEIENEYDMKADRKSIKRNLMNLMDCGYEINYLHI